MGSEEKSGLLAKDTGPKVPPPCSFRKLFSLASSSDLVWAALGFFGATIAGSCPPFTSKLIADLAGDYAKAAEDGKMDEVMKYGNQASRVLATISTIWMLAGTIQAFGFRKFREAQSKKYRLLYLRGLLHQDLAWFDSQTIASLPIQMSQDIEQITDAFGDKFSTMFMASVCTIAGYSVAYTTGWQVSLMMTAAVPFMAVAQSINGKVIASVQFESQGQYAQASEVVEESLFAMRTVITLGYEKHAIAQFGAIMEKVRKTGVRKSIKKGFLLGIIWLSQVSSYAICFFYGAICIKEGYENTWTGKPWTGAEIVAIFLCIFTCSQMLGSIDPGYSAIKRAKMCAGKMFYLVEGPISINIMGKDSRKPLKQMETIHFDNVFFHYPTRPDSPILRGVNLEIKKGEKVAFVGGSGCGKSTCIALLERFYDPSQGRVMVNGEDLRSFSISTVRQVMGFVGQEPVLFAGTIRENVMRGSPNATDDEIEKCLQMSECWFIKLLPQRLETFGGIGGGQFSGGQKQRIAIARALLRKPPVLLLDEATSALDNKSEKMIKETLDELAIQRDGNLTMISIAHRLSTIRTSNCIFMFVLGVVHEKGSHRDLMLMQGEYYTLAESQVAAELVNEEESEEEDEEEAAERAAKQGAVNTNRTSKIMGSPGAMVPKMTITVPESEKLETKEPPPKKYKAPMSRLMSFNKPEWKYIPLACLGAICTGGSFPFIGILIVKANASFYIKDLNKMYEEVVKVCIAYLIIMVVQFFGTWLQQVTCGILAEGMIKRMRIAVFTHILRQEVGFHDNPVNNPAQMGSNIQMWAHRVSTLSDAIAVNFSTFGSVLLGISMSAYFCWPVCLLMSVCFPIVIFCSMLMIIITLSGGAAGAEIPEDAKTLSSETIQNPKTIQALCIEDEMSEKFADLVNPPVVGSFFVRNSKALVAAWLFGLSNACMMYVLTLNYWFTGWLMKIGFADYLQTNMALMAIFYAAIGAGAAAVALGDNGKAQQAAQEMFALLDKKAAIDGLEPDGVTPGGNFKPGNIEFKGVEFAYPFRPDVKILRGMDFVVKQGQSVGLVGPSGGGKSTIYALIQRFYDPGAGTVLVGEERMNLKDINIRFWRGAIGVVGQEPILFNTTVRMNVIYGAPEGMEVTQQMLDKGLEMSNMGFIFEKNGAGWETEVGPKGSRLSGGQKQRVAICRALIKNPPVLLLDEATSALDNTSERIVSKALDKARGGRTSFSIAHRLSTVEDCDLILVSAEGKIVEKGKDAELMVKGGVYMKLQEAQGKDTYCCA